MKVLPLIKFNFFHNYFNDKKFHAASLSFYEGKMTAIRNYKLFLREEAEGTFVIYIEGGDNLEERLHFFINDLSENQFISLLFEADERFLFSITKDIDIKSNNQLFKLMLSIENDKVLDYNLSDFEKSEGNSAFEKKIQFTHPRALLYLTLNTVNCKVAFLKSLIENKNPLTVNIYFETKKAIWKYIFMSRKQQISDLVIIDSKQLMKFTPVSWTEKINNQQVGVAYSEKEIPYTQSYPFLFQLWKNYVNGKSLVVEQLALPNPCYTGNLDVDTEKNYISIFQYF